MDNSQSRCERVDEGGDIAYNPLVSIITPVLNGVKYLEACIESVLRQSYPHIEHIFTDGGSTDGTVDILSAYSARYPDRVRFISEPDRNIGDAANKGIPMAKGEIFGALGSDDTYEQDAVETVVEFFRSNPDAYFVYGDCNYVNEKGEIIKKMPTKDFKLKKIVNERFYMAVPSAFYRREVFEKVGPYFVTPQTAPVFDGDFVMRAAKVFEIHRIKKVFSNFRVRKVVFTGDSWERTKKVLWGGYFTSRRHGGSIFSWYAKAYYGSLMIDWLRPILSPAYPLIEKLVTIYMFGRRSV